ncbi:MAG: nucleotide exchange factor GrpE [Dehalococcoidales bacterium]|nr:nucleotide exchange factor GrpE [Dehalococcoidales bacterium]
MIQPEPEETEMEAGELQQALAEAKQKAENYLANWQRTQADFINYKRRSEQAKEEINESANAALILSLLPVLDDLERAFASIPPELGKLSWVDGIRLIEHKLRLNLEAQGLSPIKAVGEPFNPMLHEGAMHAKGKEGVVIRELQKGYRLYDRVLRPAMVVVGEGETKETESDERNSAKA